MKLDTGLMTTSLADVPAAARAAEAMGFDAVWTAETNHDPFFPLVLAAEHTQRIKLGTSIAVAFPRSPMVLAQIGWDLQALSKGRFILGLGTQVKGHNERRFGVRWEHPGPKLREMIQMIHAVWDCWQNGTKPSFVGRFYNFTLMTPFFNPGPIEWPQIPIYIAGVNEYMCRLAGELCDGFHAHPFHSIKYLKETVIPNIHKGAAKAGRKPRDCALSTTAFVITGADAAEIEAAKGPVRQQISFYASTRTYIGVLEAHGWADTCYRLNEKAAKGDWAGMASEITDEMLDVFAVTGTYDEVAGKVRAKYDGLLDRVAFYFPYTAGRQDALWGQIVPAFNG
ncbi:MAG TPA: TIGR03617 family F420-dependent LLM class oxidoreductase [Candidatus Binatia bacterium]|nr:TIGR03617 family F420-dependent LLM class oxidoreductase [Candidatus Binatia bacterium]